MEQKEFEQLRNEARHLLTLIDIAEDEGCLKWATNMRVVASVASEIAEAAKALEKRERKMNWRPVGAKAKGATDAN